MPKIDKSMLLGYSAEQMFSLVEDIESYPLFLPWCKSTLVKVRNDKKTIATLHVHYLGVSTHITTENEKEFPTRMVLRLLDGPFRHFEGTWLFESLSEHACKVEFQVSYELSNMMFDKPLRAVFGQVSSMVVEAFVTRAGEVYGEQPV